MGVECSECERDLRGGHAKDCSRYDASTECPACGETDFFQYNDGVRHCELCGHCWTPNA
jgi:ribosomal protein L37AE/L43A